MPTRRKARTITVQLVTAPIRRKLVAAIQMQFHRTLEERGRDEGIDLHENDHVTSGLLNEPKPSISAAFQSRARNAGLFSGRSSFRITLASCIAASACSSVALFRVRLFTMIERLMRADDWRIALPLACSASFSRGTSLWKRMKAAIDALRRLGGSGLDCCSAAAGVEHRGGPRQFGRCASHGTCCLATNQHAFAAASAKRVDSPVPAPSAASIAPARRNTGGAHRGAKRPGDAPACCRHTRAAMPAVSASVECPTHGSTWPITSVVPPEPSGSCKLETDVCLVHILAAQPHLPSCNATRRRACRLTCRTWAQRTAWPPTRCCLYFGRIQTRPPLPWSPPTGCSRGCNATCSSSPTCGRSMRRYRLRMRSSSSATTLIATAAQRRGRWTFSSWTLTAASATSSRCYSRAQRRGRTRR